MAYKIEKINENGSVDVTFDYDKITQNISGLETNNNETLNEQLKLYEEAYINGKELEKELN